MDHYKTLDVARTATPDEIKKAYRKLASQHHPDKGGNTAKFQELQTAYDTLSDPAKRQQYDNPRPNFGQHSQPGGQQFDFDTIFDVFGTRFTQSTRQRPQTVISRVGLTISLTDVATGGKRTIGLGHGQANTIEIDIPPGINQGDSVQYKGIAPGGGDLIITFSVRDDAKWQRQGANLHTEQPVNIWDLIVGGESVVRDLFNEEITILIPRGTQPGSRLRLRGRGLPSKSGPGDIIVQVQAVIPDHIPEDLLNMIEQKRTTVG